MRRDAVFVIGGGVVGLSVARELLSLGHAVHVLDRGEMPGVATPAAAGMLAPTSEADMEDPALLALALDSLERFPAFVAAVERDSGLDCAFRREGTLWVALDRDDLGDLEHLCGTLVARGLKAETVSAGKMLELEPHLSGRVLGGLRVEADLQVDPRALWRALRRAVVVGGGEIEPGVEVRGIELDAGRVAALECVGSSGEPRRITAERVVLAAGAWSCERIRSPMAGAGVRPVKGQLLRLHGPPLLNRVIRHPDVYLVPRRDGTLLVGATMEEQGFDAVPTAGGVYDILRHASRVLPGIYDLALSDLCVGLRPVSRDNRPLIGATATAGLFAACGHGRQGILLAPVTAHHVARAVSGQAAAAGLEPFRADRASGKAVGVER